MTTAIATTITIADPESTVCYLGNGVLSVRVPEEAAPTIAVCVGLDADGEPIEEEERDYGAARWPTDEQIAEAATRLLGREVTVRFSDKGDDLCEGIYHVADVTAERTAAAIHAAADPESGIVQAHVARDSGSVEASCPLGVHR